MDEPPAPTEESAEPADGLVTVRGALVGVALLWLAAVSAFGAVQAAAYGVLVSSEYVVVAAVAATVSVAAAGRSLRTLGYRRS